MSLTDNINHLQPTGFQIVISKTNYPNATYFAQSFIHPGIQSGFAEIARPAYNVAFPPDKMEFGTLQIMFLVDEDMESYKELDAWLRRLVCEPFVTPGEAASDGSLSSQHDLSLIHI